MNMNTNQFLVDSYIFYVLGNTKLWRYCVLKRINLFSSYFGL